MSPRLPTSALTRSASKSGAPPPRQKLGASERLFVRLRELTPINVTRVIALRGTLSPHDVQRALAALQARHPLLRTRVETSRSPAFEHERAAPLHLWTIERADDAHFRRVLEQVLNTRLAQRTGSSFAAYYLHTPGGGPAELILAGEHFMCDGVSMNSLCAELLEQCARKRLRAALPRRPTLDDMLPPFPLARRLEHCGAQLLALCRISLARRLHERPGCATRSAFTCRTLTRRDTAALLRRARTEQTTLTGALMAALTRALHERLPRARRLALSVPINLRPRLAGQALSAEDLGNFTSAAYLTSSGGEEPWQAARALKAQLDDVSRSERLLAATPMVYQLGRYLVRPQRRPLAHAVLSNSGVVPLLTDYGAFQVEGFYSATSAPMLSADVSLFCNTFDGRLTLNLLFSDELISRAEADALLARLHALLTEQMCGAAREQAPAKQRPANAAMA